MARRNCSKLFTPFVLALLSLLNSSELPTVNETDTPSVRRLRRRLRETGIELLA